MRMILAVTAALMVTVTPAAEAQSGGRPVRAIDRDPYSDLFFKTAPLPPLQMHAEPGPRAFGADQSARINGRALRYRTTLAETVVQDGRHRPSASIFTISYVLHAAKAPRPVIFAFNGGPGAAAVVAHYTFGPQRLQRDDPEAQRDPATGVRDNPLSLLDVADLVFIDPVATGFSRFLPGAEEKRFLTLDGDSDSVAAVIAAWLRSNRREGSPVYVFGESYGSLRAIAVARDLARQERPVVASGIIIAGTSLTISGWGRAPSPMLLSNRIPMMASVAFHYGKIDNRTQSWSQAVQRARDFARFEYLPALMKGYTLGRDEFDRIVDRLPAIIGLPASYFRDAGKLTVSNFNGELLKDRGLVLDSNNGLYTHRADNSSPHGYAAYDAAVEALAFGVLKAPASLGRYRTVNPELYERWQSGMTGAPSIDVTLAELFARYPHMRLLVQQGRYDTLTDLGTTEFMIAQTNLPPDRYRIAYYDGGHSITPVPEVLDPVRTMLGER